MLSWSGLEAPGSAPRGAATGAHEVLMRTMSLDEYQQLTLQAQVLSRDEHGDKVLRIGGGRILKLFRRKRWISSATLSPYARRFETAAQRLAELGFGTVTVHDVAWAPDLGRHAVIYDELVGVSLRQALASAPSRRPALLDSFARFVAHLHEKGVYFRAIHFGNILVRGETESPEFGLIDVSETKFSHRPLGPTKRARNFKPMFRYEEDAAALRQFGIDRWLEIYLRAAALRPVAQRRFLTALARKSQGPMKRRRNSRRALWHEAALDQSLVNSLWQHPRRLVTSGTMLKDGDRCTVVRLDVPNQPPLVMKRYNLKGPFHTLIHFLLRSRARWCWLNGRRLLSVGLPTPRPLACVDERRAGVLHFGSYFVTEFLPGVSLRELADNAATAAPDLIPIAEQFAAIWTSLGQLRVGHGDMKATNFMVDPHGKLWLIDLDGMRFHRWAFWFKRERRNDLERFMRNWKDQPEVAAIFRARLDKA